MATGGAIHGLTAIWSIWLSIAAAAGWAVILLLGILMFKWATAPVIQRNETRKRLEELLAKVDVEQKLDRLSQLRDKAVKMRESWLVANPDKTLRINDYDAARSEFAKWQGAVGEVMRTLRPSEGTLYSTLDIIEAPTFRNVPDKRDQQLLRMLVHHARNIKEFIVRYHDNEPKPKSAKPSSNTEKDTN